MYKKYKKLIYLVVAILLTVVLIKGQRKILKLFASLYQNSASIYSKYFLDDSSLKQIDKIYVVNLDRHLDRYKRMETILDEINLPVKYQRFSASNGKEVKLVNSLNEKDYILGENFSSNTRVINGTYKIQCPNSSLDDFYVELNIMKFSTRAVGEYGCYCSHREIWNDIIKNNYKKVLVLEDDIAFINNAREYLKLALSNLPNEADLIYLGLFRQKNSVDLSTASKFYGKISGNVASTEAYILTNNGAQILLSNTKKYIDPVDMEMSNLIENKKIAAYAILPVLTSQVLESNISAGK